VTGFWCERAWVADRGVDGVVLTVDGGMITGVESGVNAPPNGATRLDGLTLPGFANAHSHAFHRALRGRTHGGGGTFWSWRDQMYRLAGSLDPDTYEDLATATFAEMVVAGYTVVGEFHYLHHGPGGVPYADSNEMGHRMLRAAVRAGIRITLLDTCYLHGGIGEPLSDVQQRFSDGTAEAWAERVSAIRVPGDPHPGGPHSGALPHSGGQPRTAIVGAAIHSVRAVDPESMAMVATWAETSGAVLHAHVSEQPAENHDCTQKLGRTPVEVLADAGSVTARFTAVHGTHLTDRDIELLGLRRSTCCICATTERELADGIGPTAALATAGVPLCIGSDSHAVIDPFEETRAIELDERLASLRRGTHQSAELLAAATRNGYASLGWNGGTLAAGQLADFVSVSFDSPRLAGSDRTDAAAAVVFAAAPADVRHVVVDGEHVVCDGVHRRVDVVAALDHSIRTAWQASER
jgi:formiminoglutamate deiminase